MRQPLHIQPEEMLAPMAVVGEAIIMATQSWELEVRAPFE
jgi:hypothetical protein